jgi:hypothetical protein
MLSLIEYNSDFFIIRSYFGKGIVRVGSVRSFVLNY